MTIKNILAAYSGNAAKGSGLRHALNLAKHHDAWLTGVLRHRQSYLERTLRAKVPRDLLETYFENEKTRISDIAQWFSNVAAEANWGERCDFVDLDAEDGLSLSEFARPFDLVVTGVHTSTPDEDHMAANPDLIALLSGRPVLVIPDDYDASGPAEHAMVAWDGKRSAARAIGDAMPFLEEKAKVTLLTVGSQEVPGTQTLLRNLARHGIDAKLIVKPRQKSIARTILATAQEESAKLVVMGAYEHSKFSHDLFGGVTTDVIRDADVPVFLSH